MPIEIKKEFCQLCREEMSLKRSGLVLNFGFSKGGWGGRCDSIDFSDEVCQKCFNYLEALFALPINITKKMLRQKEVKSDPYLERVKEFVEIEQSLKEQIKSKDSEITSLKFKLSLTSENP